MGVFVVHALWHSRFVELATRARSCRASKMTPLPPRHAKEFWLIQIWMLADDIVKEILEMCLENFQRFGRRFMLKFEQPCAMVYVLFLHSSLSKSLSWIISVWPPLQGEGGVGGRGGRQTSTYVGLWKFPALLVNQGDVFFKFPSNIAVWNWLPK